MRHLARLGIAFLVLFSASASPAEAPLPVMANDNRTPAGQLKNGILELRLELREGVWYPEDETGGIEMSTPSPRLVMYSKVPGL